MHKTFSTKTNRVSSLSPKKKKKSVNAHKKKGVNVSKFIKSLKKKFCTNYIKTPIF